MPELALSDPKEFELVPVPILPTPYLYLSQPSVSQTVPEPALTHLEKYESMPIMPLSTHVANERGIQSES